MFQRKVLKREEEGCKHHFPPNSVCSPTHFSAHCSPNTKFTSAPSSIFLYTSLMSFCSAYAVGSHQSLSSTVQAGCHTSVPLGVAGAYRFSAVRHDAADAMAVNSYISTLLILFLP